MASECDSSSGKGTRDRRSLRQALHLVLRSILRVCNTKDPCFACVDRSHQYECYSSKRTGATRCAVSTSWAIRHRSAYSRGLAILVTGRLCWVGTEEVERYLLYRSHSF